MTPDSIDDPRGRPADVPEFDARRSAEIRALLVRTVAGTPRPRRVRLSRPAFALAATAALLFAGGVGAGTVVAVDRLTDPLVAQDASAPEPAQPASGGYLEAQSLQGVAAEDRDVAAASSAESDLPAPRPDGLTPVLTINGETGYAYPRDIDLARTGILLDASADFADAVPVGQIPIYLADGTTLLGYVDSSRLIE